MMEQAYLEKALRNLTPLEPRAKHVVCKAKFVAVYRFVDNAWRKENVEGPMFLVDCNPPGSPRSVVVLNRATTTNLILPLDFGLEFEEKDGFVMMRSSGKVVGLWIPEAEERQLFMDSIREMFSGMSPAEFTLSKEQMKEVLMRLVQDDKFVGLLHTQYLKTKTQPTMAPTAHTPQASMDGATMHSPYYYQPPAHQYYGSPHQVPMTPPVSRPPHMHPHVRPPPFPPQM